MPPREWRLRIEDILDAAARAQRYVAGMELEAFVADDRTLDAVSRCFGIIGEAAAHSPRTSSRRTRRSPGPRCAP